MFLLNSIQNVFIGGTNEVQASEYIKNTSCWISSGIICPYILAVIKLFKEQNTKNISANNWEKKNSVLSTNLNTN